MIYFNQMHLSFTLSSPLLLLILNFTYSPFSLNTFSKLSVVCVFMNVDHLIEDVWLLRDHIPVNTLTLLPSVAIRWDGSKEERFWLLR